MKTDVPESSMGYLGVGLFMSLVILMPGDFESGIGDIGVLPAGDPLPFV